MQIQPQNLNHNSSLPSSSNKPTPPPQKKKKKKKLNNLNLKTLINLQTNLLKELPN